MLSRVVAIVVLFSFALPARAGDPPPEPALTYPGQVVNVVDGDTVDVAVTVVVRIRLLDCWAAESRTTDDHEKQFGVAAKQALVDLASDKPVVLSLPLSVDSENRVEAKKALSLDRSLGRVWLNDGSKMELSAYMRDAGHAFGTKRELKLFLKGMPDD